MSLLSSLSLLSIFTTYAFAQSSQSLFVPTFPVVAYPLATGNGATTYLLGCTAGSDTSTCNFAQPYTLVQGQNTVQFALTAASQAVSLGCAIQGNTYMACSATGGPSALSAALVTAYTTFTGSEVATHFRAVALETDSNALLTWPTSTAVSTTASSASSTSAPTITSSLNITSSILDIVAPETTAAATTNAGTSLASGVTSVGSSSSGASTTSIAVPTTTASASHTKAVASGLGNAGTPGASSNLSWVFSGAMAVVVAIASGLF